MQLIRLDVEPMPAPRPRARAVRLKNGKTFVNIYNPSDYMKWKEATADKLIALGVSPAYDVPVKLHVVFAVTRPKTTKLIAPKPDIDNYVKALLDAMTDAGWWTDDTLVHRLNASKSWAVPGAQGCIHFITEVIT